MYLVSKKAKGILGSIILLIFTFTVIFVNPGYSIAASGSTTTVKTLAQGTKYATKLYVIKSGKPGPVVMIVGGIHGNEKAGYTAATKITKWKVDRGTLLVIPRANECAINLNRRYISGVGDLNRAFPRSSTAKGDTILARAIWSAVKEYKVDWLMDMHEGYDYYKSKSTNSVGQSLIYYPYKTKATATKIVSTLNSSISSTYRKFSLLRYPVKGSLARAAGQFLGVRAFIFETCDNPSLSVRVNYQVKAAKTLLQGLNMM